ncbi:glycerate kinase [Nakamurella sp. PAMC28650]|uniref:glycerate kinase n=1 Tax=Nakamurella sp. PAMC28650 TaxID=2762325 RepID=UPI00164E0A89|nr:glycerate kinase [Nakamurella sp. PAMC28650]QNK81471.1 glycerate kinase [Nakamurella sp. PAMC28650]
MRVLLAPDKFKGSLTAHAVADHLARGLRQARPELQLTLLPMADGGDGTVAAALAAGYLSVPTDVTGPTAVPVRATLALMGSRAVVELADACGFERLPNAFPAPMTAGTRGLGEMILAAARAGASSIVVGVGGSAGTDGGAGMLQALGVGVLDAHGRQVGPGGAGLADVVSLDVSGLDPVLSGVQILLAGDVDNPLLGPHGAAAVYGPQKGAGAAQVARLEQALQHWSEVVARTVPGRFAELPGAGAAGGVGFAALSVLGAQAHSGVDLVMELTGFADALHEADVVITGEGSLDAQTLQGKGPAGVASASRAAGVPVLAVAGRVLLTAGQLSAAGFDAAYALLDIEPDPDLCMAGAGRLLEEVGRRIAPSLPSR